MEICHRFQVPSGFLTSHARGQFFRSEQVARFAHMFFGTNIGFRLDPIDHLKIPRREIVEKRDGLRVKDADTVALGALIEFRAPDDPVLRLAAVRPKVPALHHGA